MGVTKSGFGGWDVGNNVKAVLALITESSPRNQPLFSHSFSWFTCRA